MNPTKAKYLGIFYTFLMAVIVILLFVYFINYISEGELLSRPREFKKLLDSLDIAIPIALMVSFLLASRLGPYIILGIGTEKKATLTLSNVLAVSFLLSYLLIDFIYLTDYSKFNQNDVFRYLGVSVIMWLFSYLIFILPSLVLGFFLKRLLLRHKP